jgi:hypothetical protein
MVLRLQDAEGMTISHYAGATRSTEAEIPFQIEAVPKHVPVIKNVDFVLSVRQKVDLTASGIDDVLIKDTGDDIGRNRVESVPSRPVSLPPGFQEVYRKQ